MAPLLLVALPLLAPSSALAWTQSRSEDGEGLAWVEPALELQLSEDSARDAGLDPAAVRAALVRAASTWTIGGGCTRARVTVGPPASGRGTLLDPSRAGPGEPDGENRVVFRSERWAGSASGHALAQATVFHDATGRILEVDIDVNAVGFDWSDGALDLETVLLHELGHGLGLGHSAVADAVMAPTAASGAQKRALHEDDVEGVCALYPFADGASAEPPPPARGGIRCSAGSRGADAPILGAGLALWLLARRPARRRRTAERAAGPRGPGSPRRAAPAAPSVPSPLARGAYPRDAPPPVALSERRRGRRR